MTVPAGIEFKTVGVLAASAAPVVKPEGIVTAIVAVTGVKDDVDDVIVPGSAARTLATRKPKVCLGHDWNRPIGKTLDIKELMPGDPGLPKATPDGRPWPREAGAIVARALYNLATRDGRDAYEQAKFYGPEEAYQSIGYRVPKGGATFKDGVRYIQDFDLLEYGPVLHSANRLAALQDVKAAPGDGLSSRSDSVSLDPMTGFETKARLVRNAEYWGLPVGTPIRPGMRPRGPIARRQERAGQAVDDTAGTVEIDPNQDLRIKPTARGKHKRNDGLFEDQIYDLFDKADLNRGERPDPFGDDFKVEDDEQINKGDSYNPLDMLVANAVPPIELEDWLRESDWDLDRPGDPDLIKRETDQFITDVIDAYREKYNAELVRQLSKGKPEDVPGDAVATPPEEPSTPEGASVTVEPPTSLSPLARRIFDDINAAPESEHIGNRLSDAAGEGSLGNSMRAVAIMLHPRQAKKKRADPERGAARHARNFPERVTETADAYEAIADVLESLGRGDDGDRGDGYGGISQYLRSTATALRTNETTTGEDGRSEVTTSPNDAPASNPDAAPESAESVANPKDMTAWPDERLDKEHEKARRAAFMSLNGSTKQKAAQDRLRKIDAERARRADAARRTVPAHPLPPDEYRSRIDRLFDRRSRMADIQRRAEVNAKTDAAITSSEKVAASAPETIPDLTDVTPVADGRIGLKNAGKASWQLVSGDGRVIAHAQLFIDPANERRTVKLGRKQADSLAARLAAITNDKGDRIPFTSEDSAAWVPGFRDSSGRDAGQAAHAVVVAWAKDNGFTPATHVEHRASALPSGGREPAPGVADGDGFYPRERAEDINVGDEVRLPDGTTHVVAEKDVPARTDRMSNYGTAPTLFKFEDGGEFSMNDRQRADVRFADDPAAEDYLRDPGMGWTPAPIGVLPSELAASGRAALQREIPEPLAPDTRIIYTPDRRGYLGEFADARPRIGRVTDRFDYVQGVWFQVVEYDDGTFDALNVAKLVADGRLTVDPSEAQQRKARQDWGLEAADKPAEPASDSEETPDAPSDLGENEGGPELTAGQLATRATATDSDVIRAMTTEQLAVVDEEMARRAVQLGKPGQVSKPHQAVRDERARREQEGASVEPEGEVIATADLDEADMAADESIGLAEGPDGELDADADVADRQDRVEALIAQADSGGLDLTASSNRELSAQRRDLVDELRFQNAVASREARKTRARNPVRPPVGEDGGDGGVSAAEPPVEDIGPTTRPGIAGGALDLADALEGDDEDLRAAARARMESLLRRSRSDSPHVVALRDAFASGDDVTPETLREFAEAVRAERRERANAQARNRRAVKRLERERIRALIGEYDAELLRRNLDPDEFGGVVPADVPAGQPGVGQEEADEPG